MVFLEKYNWVFLCALSSKSDCRWLCLLPELRPSHRQRFAPPAVPWTAAHIVAQHVDLCADGGVHSHRHPEGVRHQHRVALLQVSGDAPAHHALDVAVHNSGCVAATGWLCKIQFCCFIYIKNKQTTLNFPGTWLQHPLARLRWGHIAEPEATTAAILFGGHGRFQSSRRRNHSGGRPNGNRYWRHSRLATSQREHFSCCCCCITFSHHLKQQQQQRWIPHIMYSDWYLHKIHTKHI